MLFAERDGNVLVLACAAGWRERSAELLSSAESRASESAEFGRTPHYALLPRPTMRQTHG